MRRCELCRHGLPTRDTNDQWYRVCTLMPPQPTPITRMNADGVPVLFTDWVRPAMALNGWCGKFGWSLTRLLFRDVA